ncbi:MAG TPA: ribosome assembly RNA-binding protein YhbY [Vicinamibacterales bacterium]
MSLKVSPRERASLKARAHSLEPVVQIGHAGLTEQLVKEVDRALRAHELIKVRVSAADRGQREEICDEIAARTGAAAVQRVGKVLVLWRPNPDEEDADR